MCPQFPQPEMGILAALSQETETQQDNQLVQKHSSGMAEQQGLTLDLHPSPPLLVTATYSNYAWCAIPSLRLGVHHVI